MSSSTDAAQAAENAGETSGGKRPERKALGKYEIQKKIGAGGMGTVFLALDTELRRTVALKVLPKERAQNPMLVRRFRSEGQAAAHLRHANLVTVFEAGEIDGYLYLALEYVDGTDVHHLVEKRGPVPIKRSIAIVRQVARALAHAYEQNIVHRDIKPSNLLIQRDGSVKVTDFGLARSLDEETETAITRAGTTVGTVDYMSPEQARDSKAADIRSDLYSLGCTWYHMLTGGPPYPEGAVTNKLQAHATAALPDPRDKNPAVPEGIVAIVHRLMAKDPAARYQTPTELLADLDSPVLGRQTLSNNVLAGLADGDADSVARPVRQAALPPAEQPPAERKPAAAAPPKNSGGVDPEHVRYAIVAAIALALLGLVWWVISQFASNIDPPSDTANPFAGTEDVPRYGDAESVVARNAPPPPGGSATSPVPEETGGSSQADDAAGSEPEQPAVADSAGGQTTAADDPGDGAAREAAPADQERRTAQQPRRGEPLPDWAAQIAAGATEFRGADGEPLPVVTVGRASGAPADFAQLETALARVPRTGGIVRLNGPGPFDLTPTRVAVAGPLVIEAAEGDRPVVVLRPQHSGAPGRILQVETSSILLSGLDLLTVAEQFATDDPLTMLEVIGGGAALRDCTVTLVGERAGPTVAVRTIERTGAEGAAARADPGRVLMDRILLRGERLSALAVSRTECDAVVNHCLLVSGESPVFVVSAPPSASSAAPQPDDAGRVLRLFSTTAVSSRGGFFLEHHDGNPPATRVSILNSIVSAPRRLGAGSGTLLEFGAWPGTDSEPSSWAPQDVEFDVNGSLFPGWAALARSAAQPRAITNSTDWGRLWNIPVPLSAFPPAGWPERGASPVAPPEQYERTTAGGRVSGTDGEPPGCATDLLSLPAPEFIDRAGAMASRPIEPADSETGPLGARTVTIDASREDVGAAISRGQWENGTRFLITGSGLCRTSPVEVRGKSLSIEFVKSGGPRLCLEPLESAFAGGGRTLFAVERGHLRLVNVCVRIPATQGDGPRWFLHLSDGNFSLADCAISGPSNGEGGWEGFLRWDRRDRMDAGAASGRYSQFARIANSFLCGAGTLLRADLKDRAFVARESILAAHEGGLVLHTTSGDRDGRAAVELTNCTVATSGTFFDVQGPRGAASPNETLRFFVEQTVFAPLSTGSNPAMAAVLLRDATGRAPRRIEWWGHSNGYADGFARFLHSATSSDVAESEFDRWSDTWGIAGELRPLSESGAVQIQNPQRGDGPRPADFALVESSQARTWSPTGGPIGAEIRRQPDPGP